MNHTDKPGIAGASRAGVRWTDLLRDGRAIWTVLINLGVSLHAIDIFIIATIMPVVVADIGGAAFYTWTTMLYTTGSIAGATSGAPFRARFGRRGGYAAAGVIFLIGMVGCAMAPSMAVLLVARTLQGIGGGLVTSQSMAFVGEIYRGDLRPRMMALVATTWSVAAVIGPLIGGIFGEIDWWRGAFWTTAPLSALFVAAAWRVVTRGEPGAAVRLPWRRTGLIVLAVLAMAASSTVAAVWAKAGLLAAAPLLLWSALRLDNGADAAHRLFPSRVLSLFAPIGSAYLVLFLTFITVAALQIFLPLLLNTAYGVSPLWMGIFNTLFSFGWTAGAIYIAGRGHAGRERGMSAGVAVTAACLGLLALTAGATSLAAVAVLVIVAGVGIGLTTTPVSNWIIANARPGEEVVSASAMPAIQSLGVVFGSGVAAVLANAAGLDQGIGVAEVLRAIAWVWAAAMAAAVAAALCAVRALSLARRAD